MPVMCGVAKLLPVLRVVVPPKPATGTAWPRAKNSTGGSGLYNVSCESSSAWLPTEITEENRQGKLSIFELCADATITVPPKKASSARARNGAPYSGLVVERLKLITS